MLNLDFTNVESTDFKPVPEGIYSLVIEKAEETTSKQGNPMLSLTLQHADGTPGRIFDNLVLIEKSLWRVKQFMDAVGMDTSGAVEIDPDDLIGIEVNAKLIIDEYNGQERNKVKTYLD